MGTLRFEAQAIPIRTLEGRACSDGESMLSGDCAERGTQGIEPRPAILVPQGDPGTHLGNVGWRVVIIALQKGHLQCFCKGAAEGGFSAAADAHDEDGERTASALIREHWLGAAGRLALDQGHSDVRDA
jgi:hypothetical protein